MAIAEFPSEEELKNRRPSKENSSSQQKPDEPFLHYFAAELNGRTFYLVVPGMALPTWLNVDSKRYGNVRQITYETYLKHAEFYQRNQGIQYVPDRYFK